MKNRLIKSVLAIVCTAILTASAMIVSRGHNNGTVIVTNVQELMEAIRSSRMNDIIVLSTFGSPYNLSEQPCMNADGHLYIDKSITIRGQTGNPNDVLLIGTTNRLLYIRSTGVSINGLTFMNGNCSITNKQEVNSAVTTWGGALYLGLVTNECKVLNCIFTNNIAFRGGALASYKTNDLTTVISNCHFYCNSSEDSGGAIYNGGKVVRCIVSRNSAMKYGGGISNGIVEDSDIRDNYASKGCELNECSASLISYSLTSLDNIPKFNNVVFDRCKISTTNTYLFSGFFDVRSTAITDCQSVTLSSNPTNRSFAKYFEYYDSIGRTNYIASVTSSWNPRFINCTIANENILIKPNPNVSMHINVQNCLFYSNSVAQKVGTHVNKYLVANNCYKSVEMTKVERFLSLGWDGETVPDAIKCEPQQISLDPNDYGQSGDNWMNNTYIRKWVKFKDGSLSVTITYLQYFYARGWKGDTRQSSFENSNPIVATISNNTYDFMMSSYTTNLTWDSYYRSLGWDGVSDYTGGDTQYIDIPDDLLMYVDEISGCILNANTNILYSATDRYTNNYVYSYGSFNPMFAQSYLPSNRYAIDTSSPACHTNFWEYGIGDIWTYPREIWIESSKDLIGVPRLHGGGLDIGAYQSEDIYPK